MNFLRVSVFASVLFLLGPCVAPLAARAEMTSAHVLTGELVVTNAARNQFRLVGHGGSFTAPAGIPVEALDGKPVQVEFAGDRVLRIREEQIYFSPITHSEEMISGQLVVMDPVMRTFTFAGDGRIYAAPPGIDVRPYGGQIAEVRLNEAGQVVNIGFPTRGAAMGLAAPCTNNGQSYANGASVCQSGAQYRCESGTWRGLGTPCVIEGTTWFGSPRGCLVGDATVASGSSVCRGGTTFRCSDGNWINVGSACS